MPAGQPHSPERRQTAVDHNDEPDELEQLEKENRLLKTMLAAKLRKENSCSESVCSIDSGGLVPNRQFDPVS